MVGKCTPLIFHAKGPYVPAVLRFRVTFPDEYPRLPPLIVFNSDIFHPLVTPLTTYTYAPGSLGSDATGTASQEQLPPGGFSLKHAFPDWVGQTAQGIVTSPSEAFLGPFGKRAGELECDSDEHQMAGPTEKTRVASGISLHAGDSLGLSRSRDVPTMAEILCYIKSSFEDEKLLDDLPLGSAVCSGAWHAWIAYRRTIEHDLPSVNPDNLSGAEVRTPKRDARVPKSVKPASNWNWDGVWVQRVRTGIEASTSEPVLYAGAGVDPVSTNPSYLTQY